MSKKSCSSDDQFVSTLLAVLTLNLINNCQLIMCSYCLLTSCFLLGCWWKGAKRGEAN